MMDELFKKNIINKNLNIVELLEYAEYIKSNGDIFIIKMDGERTSNEYTILIMSALKKFETIRSDDSSLENAMLKSFKIYFKTVT